MHRERPRRAAKSSDEPDLVGAGEHRRRHSQTERLSGSLRIVQADAISPAVHEHADVAGLKTLLDELQNLSGTQAQLAVG